MNLHRRRGISPRVDRARRWVVLALAVLATAALIGVPADGSPRPAPAVPEIVRLPPGWQLNRMPRGPFRTEIALAPDGSFVVFSATPDGTMEKALLYRRSLDGGEATVFPGTEAACMPVLSPDGQWIGFWARAKLYKVAAKGGTPVPICDLKARPVGLCWGSDGNIIFGTLGAGLGYVAASGGKPGALTTVDPAKEATHRLPHLLPGGKALLYTEMPSQFGVDARIEWLSLETGKRKVLVENAADARYLSTGHLVFVRRGTLMAAPFSLDRLETRGPAVPVRSGILQALNAAGVADVNSGAGQYTVSESGALVYVSGGAFADPLADLYWVDRSGAAEKWKAFGTRPVGQYRLSANGQRLAFSTYGPEAGLWVYDMRRSTATRLTSGGQSWSQSWTSDGQRVLFSWSKTGAAEIWWAAVDGSRKTGRLAKTEFEQRAGSLTRDGRYLAFVDYGHGTGNDVRVLRMADGQVTPFADTKANEVFPEFSPDGLWLAYVSNESGRNEVYVRSFPDGKRTLPISSDGGMAPAWTGDGRQLFFWNLGFTELMKVDVSPGQNLSALRPTLLFKFVTAGAGMIRDYDLTPDGRRFLLRDKTDNKLPPVTELNLVRNWLDDVKRLCPPPK